MRAGWRIRRLTDGSTIVAGRVRRAFVPVDTDGELLLLPTLIRCGAGLCAGKGLLTLAHHSPLWLAGATCAWCVAAWRAEPETEAEEQPKQDAPAAPANSDAEIYESTVGYLRALIGDRNGVHLSEALAGLQEQGHVDRAVTAAEFGRQLQRRGVPVRASLKVAGSVGPGVHRDDLPAPAQPLPDTPAVAVG